MKLIHNNDMVAHLWANQSQSEARNSNGSLYFHGPIIYSYGSHFPIARRVDGAVLITSRGYSVTTSQHISKVRRACSHLTEFTVDNVLATSESEHRENLGILLGESCALLIKSARARSNSDFYLNQALAIRARMRDYAAQFLPSYIVPEISQQEIDGLLEKAKKQAAEKREKTAQRNAALKEKAEQERQEFYNFERDSISYDSDKIVGTLIRYNKDKNRVESSKGAECPVKHALDLYRYMEWLKNHKETYSRYQSNRIHHLGNFTVNSIDKDSTLVAGCHTIKWPEIKRFADSMGW